MISYREYLKGLDKGQLEALRDVVNQEIQNKNQEEKKTVWRVCDMRGLCHGNFREDRYLEAINFLTKTAGELHIEYSDVHELMQLKILAESVPESEYEDYFQ